MRHPAPGRIEILQRTGEGEQVLAALDSATMMYRVMDVRLWLEQADAEMKELG